MIVENPLCSEAKASEKAEAEKLEKILFSQAWCLVGLQLGTYEKGFFQFFKALANLIHPSASWLSQQRRMTEDKKMRGDMKALEYIHPVTKGSSLICSLHGGA